MKHTWLQSLLGGHAVMAAGRKLKDWHFLENYFTSKTMDVDTVTRACTCNLELKFVFLNLLACNKH